MMTAQNQTGTTSPLWRDPREGRTHLDSLVAAITAVAMGAHLPLPGPMTLTLALALALLPVWLPPLARRTSGVIGLAGSGALLAGLVLNTFSASTHHISTSLTEAQVVLILELMLGAGTLVWVRSVIGSGWMALLFGGGLLISGVMRLSLANPWKFSLSLPVTVCVLAACWILRRPRLELIALPAIALVSALNDSRSAASILATAFLILVWQRLRVWLQVRSTALRVGLNVVVLGLLSYFMMQTFILQGYLGEGAQLRSEAQIRSSGSLLLGGRPEIGATLALVQASPWGYGLGVVPNVADILTAKSGMERLNYDANNGYVERYMFGGGFEVHSLFGDFWLRCGPLGAVFLVAMLWLVLRNSAVRLAEGRGRALTTVLAIQVVWDACFSPLYTTAVMVLMLAVALHVPRADKGRNPDSS